MKNVALYVRVSSQEQKLHGLSVDNQIIALKEFAEAHNYNVVDIYNDAGISAHAHYTKRPALLKMIHDCQEGKIDLVLFTKLDRFFRSVSSYYAVVEQMNNVPWQAIWEDYETETSNGVFKVNIMLSIAQAEAERTGERIKAVNDYKRAKGWYVGKAPLGYKIVDHHLIKDEATAPYIELMFKTYLTTFSTNKTVAALADAGCPYTNLNGVRKRLASETYCGNADGSECEPYITREQHEQIIQSFAKYTRQTKKNIEYIFSGMLVCGKCGSRMHSRNNRYGNGCTCKYYSCNGQINTNKHKENVSVSERKVEKYLLNELEQQMADTKADASTTDFNDDIDRQIHGIKARLDRIGTRFELGDITVEEYKDKRQALNNEIQLLEAKKFPAHDLELPEDWKSIYTSLDDEHKRSFLRQFIRAIIIDKEKDQPFHIVWNN